MAYHLSTVSVAGNEGTPQGSGDFYQSLSAWAAAQSIIHQSGDVSEAECYKGNYGGPNGALNESLITSSFVTNGPDQLNIKAAPGSECNGRTEPNGNDFFCLTYTGGGVTLGLRSGCAVYDIYVEHPSGRSVIDIDSGYVNRCVAKGYTSLTTRGPMYVRGVGKANSSIIVNPITGSASANSLVFSTSGNNFEVFNSLVIAGIAAPINFATTNSTLTNVATLSNADLSAINSENASGTNCAFSSTTLPAGSFAGCLTNLSSTDGVDFVAPSTSDYRKTQTGILDSAGSDVSGQLTLDIVRNTFDIPYPIGPHNEEAGGVTPVPPTVTVDDTSGQAGTAIQQNATVTPGTGTGLTYAWIIQSGPGGGTFSDTAVEDPTFTPDTDGLYVLQCTVTTSDGSDADTGNCTVSAADIAPSGADAGGPYSGTVNTAIAITGTFTPGTGPGAYVLWESDKPGVFADSASASTTFTPSTVDGAYTLTFTAGNDVGTSSDTSNLESVAALTPPSNVDAGGPYAGEVNTQIAITATFDAGTGAGLSLLWESDKPGTFGNTTLASTTFTPSTVDANYTLTFTATNSEGSDSDTAALDSQAAVVPPSNVDAGGPYGGVVGTPIQLDGSYTPGSDVSPLLTWTVEAGSAGSGTFLPNANAEDPTFTPDTEGSYTLQFSVDPNDGPAVTDTASLTASAADIPVSFTGNIADIVGTVGVPITPVDVSGEFSGNLTRTYAQTGVIWPSWASLDPNSGIITGTPDVQGIVSNSTVTATDSGTNTAESNTFSFTASVAGAPIVDAGPDVGPDVVTAGVPYQLTATVDPNGNTGITYLWSFVQTEGRTGSFSDPNILNPTFTADSPDFYTLTLTVSSNESDDTADSLNLQAGFTVLWATIGNQSASAGIPYSLDISSYAFSSYLPITFEELSSVFPWNGLDVTYGDNICLIEGTPVDQDVSPQIQFRATDAKAATADSDQFTITVNPPPADNAPQIGGTQITSAQIGNTPIKSIFQGDIWLWTFGDWNLLYHPPLRMQIDDFEVYSGSPDPGTITLDAGSVALGTSGFTEFGIPATQVQQASYDEIRMQLSSRADSQYTLDVWEGIPEEVGSSLRGTLAPGDFLDLYANNSANPYYLKADNPNAAERFAYITELYVYGNNIFVPFSLDSTGLRHRAEIPQTGTSFADQGSEAGNFTMIPNTEDGPDQNVNLGYGLAMTTDTNCFFRGSPKSWWIPGTHQGTISFWSKVAPGYGGGGRICTGGVQNVYSGYSIRPWCGISSTNYTQSGDAQAGTFDTNRRSVNFQGPETRDSTWHHMAFTFDFNTPVNMYVDGVEYEFIDGVDGSGGNTDYVNNSKFRFNVEGWLAVGEPGRAWGSIADFRMYDVIKTPAEILSIANKQS